MASSQLIQLDQDTSLNVVFSGTPGCPTLVFLHFWGGSARTFSTTIAELSSDFHSIAVDFRGWGNSVGPQTPDAYSIRHHAADIESLITKLNIEEFVLVGHSMGGKVAQLIAGKSIISGLKGVVLIGPAPPTPLVISAAMKEQQMAAYSSTESSEFVVRNVLTSSSLSSETIALLVEDILKGSRFAKLAWPVYAMLENIVQEAMNIKVPVLIVAGELDRIEPLDRLELEVIKIIPGAKMVIVNGSGHLIPVEAPVQLARCIKDFADKVNT